MTTSARDIHRTASKADPDPHAPLYRRSSSRTVERRGDAVAPSRRAASNISLITIPAADTPSARDSHEADEGLDAPRERHWRAEDDYDEDGAGAADKSSDRGHAGAASKRSRSEMPHRETHARGSGTRTSSIDRSRTASIDRSRARAEDRPRTPKASQRTSMAPSMQAYKEYMLGLGRKIEDKELQLEGLLATEQRLSEQEEFDDEDRKVVRASIRGCEYEMDALTKEYQQYAQSWKQFESMSELIERRVDVLEELDNSTNVLSSAPELKRFFVEKQMVLKEKFDELCHKLLKKWEPVGGTIPGSEKDEEF